ncbi:MAG: YraN family protein [Muribaculum sp.]|nr:YraN family protein [Muribaculum sp.]
MSRHNELGKLGEQIARDYLVANGYAIYSQNTRDGHYEIDIVAFKGSRVIFVEVKTRSENSTDPLEAITPQKISRMCSSANRFIRSHNIPHEAQFDIITIIVHNDGTHELNHIPDAFFPPLRGAR